MLTAVDGSPMGTANPGLWGTMSASDFAWRVNIQQTMKPKIAILLVSVLFAPSWAGAELPATPSASATGARTLFIGPSSASLSLGKANLNIGAVSRRAGALLGEYKLDVTPFFFKSEKGKISMSVSDAALSKLTQGESVEFTGKATTNGTGETRAVQAKAVPSANDRGTVTFSFLVEAGKLVFNAPYRFAEK
jgi:hypothetical protein